MNTAPVTVQEVLKGLRDFNIIPEQDYQRLATEACTFERIRFNTRIILACTCVNTMIVAGWVLWLFR